MVEYYKKYRKDFLWKYYAKEFIRQLKGKAKKKKLKIKIELLPITQGMSGVTGFKQKGTKVTYTKSYAEHRTIGFQVRWHYEP